MKRLTLAMLFVAVTAAGAMAQVPVPPAPPARPAPAPRAPAARPAPRPAAPVRDIDADMDRAMRDMDRSIERSMAGVNLDLTGIAPDINIDVDGIRAQSRELAEQAREAARLAMEDARVNDQAAREAMRDASRDLTREASRMADQFTRDFTPYAAYAPMAPMAPMPPMPAIAPMAFGRRDLSFRTPPAAWAQGDPADSLYRVARNVLQSGDYGRAARLFSEIAQKYPKSAYANDAPYWEATARYRIGTTEELRLAAKVLEPLVGKTTSTSGSNTSTNVSTTVSFGGQRAYAYVDGMKRNTNDSDVAALYARINGQLAQRGDRDAAEKVAKAAQAGTSCDQEDMQVKIEALNALSQMDPAQAAAPLRHVLERKDDCSASLRRNAVFMLGRRADAESGSMLINVAKSDPNYSVRITAIETLSRVPGDASVNALEDLLRNDQDERIQRAVVGALMRSDNPKARSSMRALIDRKDASVNLRIEAINSFNSDRATPEDGAYLRALYGKVEGDNLKRAVIDAVSRVGGPENEQWVLALAKNSSESSQVRAEAISRLMRSNISIADVGKLYDSADSYNMRAQLINVLRSRKDPEASDKLVDIAKNGTDYKLRTQAINALASRNDPRSQQLMIEILDGKKP